MKKLLCVLLLAVVVLFAGCGDDHGGVIGTVNGQNIYQDEYDYYFAYYFEYYYQNYYSYYQQLLGIDLMDEESAAPMLGDFESAAWEASISAALIEQVAAEYGVTYEDNYLMDNLPWGDYRTIRVGAINALLYDAVRQAMLDEMVIPEAQSKAAYDADPAKWDCRKASHILIGCDTTDEASLAEAKATAEDVIAQLQNGADFAELAVKYSSDSSASNGGDLGVYFNAAGDVINTESSFFKEFVDATYQLKNVGDYTLVPVLTSAGYHIIKLDDVCVGYEAVKSMVDDSLKSVSEEDLNDKVAELLATARENATVNQKFKFKYYVEENTDLPAEDGTATEDGQQSAGDQQAPVDEITPEQQTGEADSAEKTVE